MKRLSTLSTVIVLVTACGGGGGGGYGDGSSTTTTPPTTPSPASTTSTFNITLSPQNEVPAITNAESSCTGTTTITFHTTKDSAGNVTAATVDFNVRLSGVPGTTTVTAAHIHPGTAGTNGGILVNTGLTSGELTISGGNGSITKNDINVDPAVAQQIINGPANYYFNIHSTLNSGGFARGQLGAGGGSGGGTPPPDPNNPY